MTQTLDLTTLLKVIGDPDALIAWIRQKRDEYGPGWLEEIKGDFPLATWLVDLVANHTAEQAVRKLGREYPGIPFFAFRKQLTSLHGKIREEIDRPR